MQQLITPLTIQAPCLDFLEVHETACRHFSGCQISFPGLINFQSRESEGFYIYI